MASSLSNEKTNISCVDPQEVNSDEKESCFYKATYTERVKIKLCFCRDGYDLFFIFGPGGLFYLSTSQIFIEVDEYLKSL